jgi:hypothetical protein
VVQLVRRRDPENSFTVCSTVVVQMQNLVNVRDVSHALCQYVGDGFVVKRVPNARQKCVEGVTAVDGDRFANFLAYPLNGDN